MGEGGFEVDQDIKQQSKVERGKGEVRDSRAIKRGTVQWGMWWSWSEMMRTMMKLFSEK